MSGLIWICTPAAESWNLSGSIANVLAPVLQGFYDLLQGLAGLTGHSMPLSYGEFVRKLAHLAEYFLLGAECALVAALLSGGRPLRYIWSCLFVPLAVAVMDEFLQQFAGRTSLVSDVVVDFAGAIVGVAVVMVVGWRVGKEREELREDGGVSRGD